MLHLLKKATIVLATTMAVVVPTAYAGAPKEINISYVKAPFNLQLMVMRQQQLLEREFEADGIRVQWHDITSGAHQAQAMAAGALDIGGVMNTTSILLANAGGNPVRIAASVSRPAESFAIVGRAGGPTSITDLRGTKVAGPRGTVLHQLLAAALNSEGMKLADVEFVGMDLPAAQTAVLAGHVDAALLAAGLKIKAEEAGAAVITTADGLVNPVLVMGVREPFARDHADTLERIVRVHREATEWVAANLEQAIALGADEQGISVEDGRKLAQWANFTATLRPSDLDSIAEDMAFLIDNDMLQSAVDVPALVLPGVVVGD